ncbi:MAG: VOC family protein [Frankiaceae bacterium]
MVSAWFSVVIEARDRDRMAEFWCAALGYAVVHRGAHEVDIAAGADAFPGIAFVLPIGDEPARSRLHLDLAPDDQAAEIERLTALGATVVDTGQDRAVDWVVLADPEGNRFCVLAPQDGW